MNHGGLNEGIECVGSLGQVSAVGRHGLTSAQGFFHSPENEGVPVCRNPSGGIMDIGPDNAGHQGAGEFGSGGNPSGRECEVSIYDIRFKFFGHFFEFTGGVTKEGHPIPQT